jgi:trimeric autotransporter adhesin
VEIHSIIGIGDLALRGSTSGTLTHRAAATTTDYTITWPASLPSGGFFSIDGSGNISFESDVSLDELNLIGSVSGTLTHRAAATTTDYTITWPDALGTGGFFEIDGSGNVSFVTGTAGDPNYVGENATATPSATGTDSLAMGHLADASAENSLAIGQNSISSNVNSISIGGADVVGQGATSTSPNSISIGRSSSSSGSSAIAIGGTSIASQGATSTTSNSISIGRSSLSSGASSIAIGGNTVNNEGARATDNDCIAIGRNSQATSGDSIAIGRNSQATFSQTIAIGGGFPAAEATGNNAISIGNGTMASSNFATAIGSGSTTTGAAATGENAIAVGRHSSASQPRAIAIGGTNISGQGPSAASTDAIAVGKSTLASGSSSIAIGGGSDDNQGARATSSNAIAIGHKATSSASTSVSLGFETSARNVGQHARSNGSFSTPGDSLYSRYVCRGSTTDDTPTNINPDGGTTNRLILLAESAWMFRIDVIAREDVTNDAKAMKFEGAIKRDDLNNTTLMGAVSSTLVAEDAGATDWDIIVSADDTLEALQIQVTGETAKTIRWVATVHVTEVQG